MMVVSVEYVFVGKILEGGEVMVCGWVCMVCGLVNLVFVNVSDGFCFVLIQVVVNDILVNFDEIKCLISGCLVIGIGILVKLQGKGQLFEIQVSVLEVVGWVEDLFIYLIQFKLMLLEFLCEVVYLCLCINLFGVVICICNCLVQVVYCFFYENGFNWISILIIIIFDVEGVGQMFCVFILDMVNLFCDEKGVIDFSCDFFGKEIFLIVFGQLNVEVYCLVLSKVYIFGLIFCVENSYIICYLVEFWMIELEIVFVDLVEDVCLVEEFLKYLFCVVLNECSDDLVFIVECVDKNVIIKLEDFINVLFECIDYIDVVSLLQKFGRKFDFLVEWGLDLQIEYECWLIEEYVGCLVVVINYLEYIKVFYMCLNDDGKIVVVMDVLVLGIGEIIGGSQCEECLDVLDVCMVQFGLDCEYYSWYCDFCCYGLVLYVGFGLGFECLVVYVCGLFNICDVIFYLCVLGSVDF